MAVPYNHKAIEKKWKEKWAENPVNPKVDENGNPKKKYYCLDMFPYPSGNGLHVGHWRGYVISDVWSRYKLLQGYYIIHPMGWDAFGLPAENYAIKMGTHPAKSTAANIANIKRQINEISALYDWDMEVNTTDPDFYKWTQWIFVKMFKEGLAYEKEFPINWCPSCKTGLANEEVVGGKCERCGAEVTKKNLRQWMLRITKYADRLLNDLDKLDWPEKVKKMQTDWIGKSYGAEVDFPVEGREDKITVYTTRPDTLHGATFMVLAPEHKLATELATPEHKEEVEKYIFDSSMKSNVDRLQDKEKTGVFTGTYAINPLNGAKVPIWLSDYVLADYGTGAIMCVPAHDDRDFEFATKFNIPIIQVIAKDGKEIENMTEAYTEASGTMINSGEWNGMESSVLKKEAPHIIEERGIGRATVNYKLRDWVFSRQRYWGEPIPIVHCPECGAVPVPEDQLPLRLPDVESYEPTGTGESPLAGIDEWVNTTCPVCGKPAKRETNTMPQWAGSSWYFLRYVDNHNNEELVSREKADAMLPVDMNIGGVEHITRQNDNSFNLVIQEKLFADFIFVGVVQSTVCQKKSGNAVIDIQLGNHVQNPGIVCIGYAGHTVTLPTGVIEQLIFATPPLEVKRRVGHDEIHLFILVQILREGGGVLLTKVVGDATDSQIHLAQTPSLLYALLPDDRDIFAVSVVAFHEFMGLHKHTTRTAARVIYHTAVRLDHFSNQLNNASRGIEFTVFLGTGGGIYLEEVFVHTTDEVFFMETGLIDFVDFIDKLLDFLLRCTESSIQV